ncbi:hypothetical protein PR003_g27288 [Phytophthora rubi]|uniref:Uncharacterized protein n=1 Tax=Phytophthora rubi TaxID=129364 RepID=A0A6A3MSK7_9STRA|nr:hypothetical protein PR001_g10620 [Phytophthora rubi]KAE9282876.1 hypothetical protein PR003_g27288 [Phytophthora rubi]
MEPSDNSSSSDSSDGDSDSSSLVYSAATNTMGDTSVTFKLYMYPTGLEDFDEDAPLPMRKRWWERFVHLAVQCGWSNRTKLYEFKLMVSPAVRNWRGSFPSTSDATGPTFQEVQARVLQVEGVGRRELLHHDSGQGREGFGVPAPLEPRS